MPHTRRTHARPRFRGPRLGGGVTFEETPIIEDTTVIVDPSQLDLLLVPPIDANEPKVPGAGSLLPTFVTPEDAKAYLNQVKAGYDQLDIAIVASNVPLDFKASWGVQIGSWNTFYTTSTLAVGWLNTTAVMDQADRYQAQLIDWRASFAAAGGTPPGPVPIAPGQGVPSTVQTADFTKLALAVGVVAALFVFGPAISRHL